MDELRSQICSAHPAPVLDSLTVLDVKRKLLPSCVLRIDGLEEHAGLPSGEVNPTEETVTERPARKTYSCTETFARWDVCCVTSLASTFNPGLACLRLFQNAPLNVLVSVISFNSATRSARPWYSMTNSTRSERAGSVCTSGLDKKPDS
ncbi:hypothetical protein FRC12_004325 [Ceratobasidium sp. 428]|nr:hypothetical protein FRC12_004325 [Ceratobasidium sp. 428]